jgi:Spy/CpxP family protein refolding chaperone
MRFSLVFALFVAVPLLAFGQRYGGAGTASVRRADQQTPPPASPAATTSKQGQERGQTNELRLSWEWWKDAEVRKQLQLTDQQVRDISRIYDDRVRQTRPTYEALQRHLAELNKMARERTVDVSTYSVQVTSVEGLRSEVNKTRSVLLYAISRRLSPEQHQKLGEIWDRRRSGRGNGPASRR